MPVSRTSALAILALSPATAEATAVGGAGGAAPNGGDGGVAESASAVVVSNGGAEATARATVVGGAGGAGDVGFGGRGADASLGVSGGPVVRGFTEGTLTLHQQAVGGAGGTSAAGQAGAAGSAESLLTSFDYDGGVLDAVSEAIGGAGPFGLDGDAEARIFVSRGPSGAAANATAIAHGHVANALAEAFAGAGTARSLASSAGGRIASIRATALAPVASRAIAGSHATVGGGEPGPVDGRPQAFASATGLPDASAVDAVLAAHPSLSPPFLGGPTGPGRELDILYSVGAAYSEDGSGAPATYSSMIELELDTPLSDVGRTLLLGFYEPFFSEDGWVDLAFRVLVDDALLFEESFAEADEAIAYFTDRVLALGLPATVGGLPPERLKLAFDFTTASNGFFFLRGLVDVPEPATACLVCIALLGLAGSLRATVQPAKGPDGARTDD